MSTESRVFSALLKYWRTHRGLSQLDLALAADVSSRHISFLETGRSRPSEDMVLLLASTLDVPLRERNVMLREAGFAAAFDEPSLEALNAPGIEHALAMMLQRMNPFPMMVLDRAYTVLRLNEAARRMATVGLGSLPETWNAMRALFDPNGFRPYVLDWESTAQSAVARLHREVLRSPHDERLAALLEEVLAVPGVSAAWRQLDPARGAEGALTLRLHVGGQVLSFITSMMSFHAPQNVTLDEIQIESYLPADEATELACAALLGGAASSA
ncbi:MAG: helix-turn-helix transcriptional regulator [Bacteroidota bacterium]